MEIAAVIAAVTELTEMSRMCRLSFAVVMLIGSGKRKMDNILRRCGVIACFVERISVRERTVKRRTATDEPTIARKVFRRTRRRNADTTLGMSTTETSTTITTTAATEALYVSTAMRNDDGIKPESLSFDLQRAQLLIGWTTNGVLGNGVDGVDGVESMGQIEVRGDPDAVPSKEICGGKRCRIFKNVRGGEKETLGQTAAKREREREGARKIGFFSCLYTPSPPPLWRVTLSASFLCCVLYGMECKVFFWRHIERWKIET